jgi:hypothetical protein
MAPAGFESAPRSRTTSFESGVRDDGIGIEPEVGQREGRVGDWELMGTRERTKRIGGKPGQLEDSKCGASAARATEVQLIFPASTAYSRWRRARFLGARKRKGAAHS